MPDRSWEHGLHQLIETKEGLAMTQPRETISRITYQRFFRRYLRLAGMTGTEWKWPASYDPCSESAPLGYRHIGLRASHVRRARLRES